MSSASKVLLSNWTEISFEAFNSTTFDGCSNGIPYESTWQATITLLVLVFINILIIVGNTLVITAVFVTKKLRTTTNLFIMSLAIADFFVGVAVLPYSLSLEVLDVWIFGDVWCSLWLAIDVLLCTASILHLCAISLDRYLAITHPINYPQLMNQKRSRILITAVWLAAFAISIPPLLGWNETGAVLRGSVQEAVGQNSSALKTIENAAVTVDAACYPTCDLIADRGYRIYSALGSFFVPMFVMVFFYWRIYIEATKSTKAMKRGFKEVSGGNLKGEGLRIHRGGTSHRTSNGSTSGSQYRRSSSVIKVDTITCVSSSPPSPSSCSDDHKSLVIIKNRKSGLQTVKSASQLDTIKKTLPMSRKFSTPNASQLVNGTRRSSNLSVNCDSLDTLDSESLSGRGSIRQDSRFYKVVKLRRDFRKFSHEMKAAKTLAIIVGGFIICWLPFFTIYFIGAFCEDCIDALLFSICFWLGYCNSALNPIVYALFNKDYRYAFQKIVKCNFTRSSPSRVTYGSGDSLTLYRMPSNRRQNGKIPAY